MSKLVSNRIMKEENINPNILIFIDTESLKIVNKYGGQLSLLNIYRVP